MTAECWLERREHAGKGRLQRGKALRMASRTAHRPASPAPTASPTAPHGRRRARRRPRPRALPPPPPRSGPAGSAPSGSRATSGSSGTWRSSCCPRERIVGGRFEREARAAARLSHPGIVTLYEAAVDDDGAYLVSELVRGPTLGELLEAGRLSDRDIVAIGIALCDALDPRPRARGSCTAMSSRRTCSCPSARVADAGRQADRLRRRPGDRRRLADPHRGRDRDRRLHGA